MKETNTSLKQTEIGRIPKEWKVVRMENVCNITKSGGTPLTSKKEYYNGEIPFVKIEDITRAKKYLVTTHVRITKLGLDNSNAWLVPKNSLLLAIYGSLGAVTINKIEVATNQAILGIVLKDETITEFFYYFLVFYKKYLERQAKHTTQANLTLEIIKKIPVPLPPLTEQKKIAEVLSTVDEAIRKVDEAIAKTERFKKGLMQKLLTKGGEVVRLGDERIADLIMGQSPPSSTYNNKGIGIPFLQGNAEFGEMYPKPVLSCSQPKKLSEKNDILLSVRAPVGDVNITPYKLCIGRGLAAIRPKIDKLDFLFLFYYLKFESRIFESLSMGSTFKAIRKGEVEKFNLPLPPLPEQQKIAEILSGVDKKLELERKRKEKLERIKKGLMNDLLTGRKRVFNHVT